MKYQHLFYAVTQGLALASLSPLATANSPEQIFLQASPSVVVVDVFTENDKPIGQGSGAVIGEQQVITNCHVASTQSFLYCRVKFFQFYPSVLIGKSPFHRLSNSISFSLPCGDFLL